MRRSGLVLAGLLAVVGCRVGPGAGKAGEPRDHGAAQPTIVHSVYFWLKDDAKPEDAETLVRDCKGMLGPLPCVKRLDVGVPLGKSRGAVDSSYHVGLVVYFADQEAYDTYLKHPDHLRLVEKYRPRWKRILVYDFVRK